MKNILLIITFILSSLAIKAQYQVPDYIQNYDSDKPTVYAVDLGGGYQQVADSTAKADLSSDKRVVGMMVSYKDNGFWVTERYEGSDVLNTNWRNDNNWNRVAITDTLQYYVLRTELTDSLSNYTSHDSLSYYLLATQVRQDISDSLDNYVSRIELNDSLANYATQSALEDTASAIRSGITNISLGTDGQVPYMNPAGTDLLYSTNFKKTDNGLVLAIADSNLFIGRNAGDSRTSAAFNVGVGYYNSSSLTTGTSNASFGNQASRNLMTGNQNTNIGAYAGYSSTVGSGNVRLGYRAGYYWNGNDRLFIDNSDDTTPLIYGDFANDSLRINGTLSTLNPKFYAAFADSLEVIAMTQNVYSHITGTVGELFTSYRAEHGFTFQNDSVQIPANVSGWYELKYSLSFQGAASDVYHVDFFVDNVEIGNRASRERSTTNNAIGSKSGFMDYQFSGGEWVKLMTKNTGNNNDMTIISCDWSIKYDE